MKEINKTSTKSITEILDSLQLSNNKLSTVFALLMLHTQVTLAMSNNEVMTKQQVESIIISNDNVTQDLQKRVPESENIFKNDVNGKIKQIIHSKRIHEQTDQDVQQLVSSIKDQSNKQTISSSKGSCSCSTKNKGNNARQENDVQEGTKKSQESINI